MKNNNNQDDAKGLCFSVILIVTAILAYFGASTCIGHSSGTMLERAVAIPAMITLWLAEPKTTDPELLIFAIAFTGSALCYFLIGVALLALITYVIKKWRGGGGGNNGKGNRI